MVKEVATATTTAAAGMPFHGSMNDANAFGSMNGGFVDGNAAIIRPNSALNGIGSCYGENPNSSAYGGKLGSVYGSMGGNEFSSTLQQNLSQRGSMSNIANNNGNAMAGSYGSGVFFSSNNKNSNIKNNNSMMRTIPPQGSSMVGSMRNLMGSMYGPMGSFHGPSSGSMYRLGSINHSLYSATGNICGNGSMYGPYGSMYGMGGSMYRPMGSMYGASMLGLAPRMTSAHGFAAQ